MLITKKKLAVIFTLFTLLIVMRFCVLLPDHFSTTLLTQDIQEEFDLTSQESQLSSHLLKQITSRPLVYLGKGSQAIAFASSDGEYVIKFFLNERFHTKVRFRSPFRKVVAPRIRYDVLQRYALAFQKIREEVGIIGVHLSANTQDLPLCTLQDPKGNQHYLDLNKFSFILQKRCTCIDKVFSKMSFQEKRETVIALENLMNTLACKGFYNLRDSFKDENFAVLDGKAYIIDVGNIVFSEATKIEMEQESERIHSMLGAWMRENSFSFDQI